MKDSLIPVVMPVVMSAKRCVLITLMALLIVTPVLAETSTEEEVFFPQQQSAQQLLMLCASSSMTPSGRKRQKYCDGFVSGVEEALRFSSQPAGKNRLCVPKDIPAYRLRKAFTQYANSHEADLVKPAVAVVVDALTSSFPCTE